jgi:hypothetical protein
MAKSGGPVVTLASSSARYAALAVGGGIYWSSTAVGMDGQPADVILDLPLDGGSISTIATVSGMNFTQSVPWIAVDASDVCWPAGPAILKASLGGGLPVTLATVTYDVSSIATDGTSVYWTNGSTRAGGTVMSVAVEGGEPRTLATGQNGPTGIAVDEESVYWSVATPAGSSIVKVAVGGGVPTTLAAGQSVAAVTSAATGSGIAVDATSLYWVDVHNNSGSLTQGTVVKLSPK